MSRFRFLGLLVLVGLLVPVYAVSVQAIQSPEASQPGADPQETARSPQGGSSGETYRDELGNALEQPRIGAEITVLAQGRNTRHESLLYEDVEVVIEGDPGHKRVSVTFTSDPPDGSRVFILDLHQDVVGAGGLDVRYFTAHDRSGESPVVHLDGGEDISGSFLCRPDRPGFWSAPRAEGHRLFLCVPPGPTHTFVVAGHDGPDGFAFVAPLGLGILAGLVVTVRLRRLVA